MPSDLRGQFPGEIRVAVFDVLSGRPVASADVEVADAAPGRTDASGAYRVRGLPPGLHQVRVQAPGYAPQTRDVPVRNGAAADLRFELVPRAVELEGLVAEVDAGPDGARSLTGERLRSMPARTAGDLAAALPGVQVTSRGRGGSEVPSIRGSGGDAVLVLVDGVPINDPLTGEADLSTLPAGAISALHVLPGGGSARYGAGAEGGVILIETGRAAGTSAAGTSVGSLGERSADLAHRWEVAAGTLGVGADVRRMDGGFRFDIPPEAGGGRTERENARVGGESARVDWRKDTTRTGVRLVAGAERLERGLPGRSYAPSRSGTQRLSRVRASASFDVSGAAPTGASGSASGSRAPTASLTPTEPARSRVSEPSGGPWRIGLDAWTVLQRTEHRDTAPPFGDPFDDRTSVDGLGAEIHASLGAGRGARWAGGIEVSRLAVTSTQLADARADLHRDDAGAWLSLAYQARPGLALSAALRTDRSGVPARWYASHDFGVSWVSGGLSLRAGHRSSFSPPTLGDQFFREGVGVEPNPNLEAERVPSEWSAAVAFRRTVAGALASLELEAYRGDIRGMILWLPDFRFVWSPQNQDVHRSGAELGVRWEDPARGWELRGHVAWNRTTYDRPGLEGIQIVYRPRVAAGVLASWSGPSWRGSLGTELVGARHPVPNRWNELPAFWATDLAVARRWASRAGTIELGLEIDRLFDHEDSLIFAFPDPGRTARILLRIVR
jgi:outer membrane cobalamin receptor